MGNHLKTKPFNLYLKDPLNFQGFEQGNLDAPLPLINTLFIGNSMSYGDIVLSSVLISLFWSFPLFPFG